MTIVNLNIAILVVTVFFLIRAEINFKQKRIYILKPLTTLLMLAINRFRWPFKYNRVSLAFYYAGQTLIALNTIAV